MAPLTFLLHQNIPFLHSFFSFHKSQGFFLCSLHIPNSLLQSFPRPSSQVTPYSVLEIHGSYNSAISCSSHLLLPEHRLWCQSPPTNWGSPFVRALLWAGQKKRDSATRCGRKITSREALLVLASQSQHHHHKSVFITLPTYRLVLKSHYWKKWKYFSLVHRKSQNIRKIVTKIAVSTNSTNNQQGQKLSATLKVVSIPGIPDDLVSVCRDCFPSCCF